MDPFLTKWFVVAPINSGRLVAPNISVLHAKRYLSISGVEYKVPVYPGGSKGIRGMLCIFM